MKEIALSIPEFAFVVATRAALGAGVGMLLANKLGRGGRRNMGLALVVFGALTTIPAAIAVFGGGLKSKGGLVQAA